MMRRSLATLLFAFPPSRVSVRTMSVLKHQVGESVQQVTSTTDSPQKVAIVGSGAVGSYYGARLWEIGHDVHFYMRGDHLRACRDRGLLVRSEEGDIHISRESIQLHSETETIGKADWVIVALKSTSLDDIPSLIEPLLDPSTRVAAVMNGMIDDDLVSLIKHHFGEDTNDRTPPQCCKTICGCMAFIASNRVEPGVIHHVGAKGALSAGVAATREDDNKAKEAFQALWSKSKVPVSWEQSLLRGRWEKMMWNLPFSGISVALGGITTDVIMEDPGLRELAEIIMDETIHIANADLEQFHGNGNFEPLGDFERDGLIAITETLGPYKTSTMLDLVNRNAIEVKYLFQIPLERAHKLGVQAPYLHTIVNQIAFHQRLHKLY